MSLTIINFRDKGQRIDGSYESEFTLSDGRKITSRGYYPKKNPINRIKKDKEILEEAGVLPNDIEDFISRRAFENNKKSDKVLITNENLFETILRHLKGIVAVLEKEKEKIQYGKEEEKT